MTTFSFELFNNFFSWLHICSVTNSYSLAYSESLLADGGVICGIVISNKDVVVVRKYFPLAEAPLSRRMMTKVSVFSEDHDCQY